MKAVSAAYIDSMRSGMRNRSFVRIHLANVNESAAVGSWTSNVAQASYSTLADLDSNESYPSAAATLEQNLWILDGMTRIVETSGDDGYATEALSDANGDFSTPPTLTKQYTGSPVNLQGLTLEFDSRRGFFPLSVQVEALENSDVKMSVTSEPKSAKWGVDSLFVTGIDELRITILKTLPYRRARLEQVIYGAEIDFTEDDLESVKQTNDVDPISRRLQQATLEFSLIDYDHRYDPDNPQGVFAYFEEKIPISVTYGYELPDGTVEWLAPDYYVLTSRPVVQNSIATFRAVGLIETMTESYYKDVYRTTAISLKDLAENVLTDANLPVSVYGENPWSIDASLENIFTTATLPVDTHANCLQLIAHAARCQLYTDDDNIIHMKPFTVVKDGLFSGSFSGDGESYSTLDSIDLLTPFGSVTATLEQNRWVLDGSATIVSDEPMDAGFVSTELSGSTGDYSNDPVLTRTFVVDHDFPIVNVTFGEQDGDIPDTAAIAYYAGDTLIGSFTESITTREYRFVHSIEQCDKIVLTVDGVLPYRRARISRMSYYSANFALDFNTIWENSQSSTKVDLLKSVLVDKNVYTIESNDPSDIFEGTTTEQTMHVDFGGLYKEVTITVTGDSSPTKFTYGRAADIVFSSVSGEKSVKITGISVTESSVVVSLPVTDKGSIDEEHNPLITSDAEAKALGNHIAAYLQMRSTYDAEYRGNPELECGDVIGLQSRYSAQMNGLVLTDELTFNGALSGKVKVKALI